MNSFLDHIISRHSDTTASIKPRLPGRFETGSVDTSSPVVNPVANDILPTDKVEAESFQPNLNRIKEVKKQNNTPDLQDGDNGRTSNTTPALVQPLHHKEIHNELMLENKMNEEDNSFVYNNPPQSVIELSKPSANATQVSLIKIETPIKKTDTGIVSAQSAHQHIVKPVHSPSLFNNNEQDFSDGINTSGKEQARPVIKVSIGRIEVRAIQPAQQTAARKIDTGTRKPDLSLDDYLQKRK